jgi:hypothetical protein
LLSFIFSNLDFSMGYERFKKMAVPAPRAGRNPLDDSDPFGSSSSPQPKIVPVRDAEISV